MKPPCKSFLHLRQTDQSFVSIVLVDFSALRTVGVGDHQASQIRRKQFASPIERYEGLIRESAPETYMMKRGRPE